MEKESKHTLLRLCELVTQIELESEKRVAEIRKTVPSKSSGTEDGHYEVKF